MFDEILLPEVVAFECRRDLTLPSAHEIHQAIEQRRLRIVEVPSSSITFPEGLGPGERAAISLARAEDIGILMDDRSARRFAQSLGVTVLGTGGFLLIAKQRRIVKSIGPLLAKIRKDGYRISPRLVDELLRRAGES